MTSYIYPTNEFLRPAGETGVSSELKKNSKQQNKSKIVKQRVLSPQGSQNPKYEDKLKMPAGLPYSDWHREQRRYMDEKISVQAKSSGNHKRQSVKANTSKEDELVKHMSNLPGYLQRAQKEENLQEKALNFGVLDWAQLEKWKHKQKQVPDRGSNNASCSSCDISSKATSGSSTFSSTVQSKAFAKQRSLPHSTLNSAHKLGHPQGAKPSVRNVIQFQDFETASKSNRDGQKKVPWTQKSSGGKFSDIILDKGKRRDSDHKITSKMGNLTLNSGTNEISLNQKHKASAGIDEAKKSREELRELRIRRKDRDQKLISETGAGHSNGGSYGVSLGSKEKLSTGNGERRKRVVEELKQTDIDLTNRCSPGEHNNIVLLRPNELLQNEFSEVFRLSQPEKLSKEKSSEAQGSHFSGSFSREEFHRAELCSEIPHSCPLPSRVETNAMSDIMPHSLINARAKELSSVAHHTSQCSDKTSTLLSKGVNVEKFELDLLKLTNLDVDTSKTLDEEITELAAGRGRNPSPNRRFSFSLSRVGRSFSFKEGSSVPQLSSSYVSVKSGPVRSETSAYSDTSNREKSNGHKRVKSSPLRRLLDPILKYKASNSFHSDEESLDSFCSRPTSGSDTLQNEKHEASTTQAFLQLTVKNGLPLFSFAVKNDKMILAATMKNLTSSGKDDSGRYYTFYFVNEIKKKSGGWISQGSKRPSRGCVYNVIGQMKVSSSSNNQFLVRESVLSCVELRQADQEPLKLMSNKELAAVVVKIPDRNISHDGMESDKDFMEKLCIKCLPEDRCSCNYKENEDSDSIVVILPSGAHGSPSKGEPSPLMDRWKSGGSCDCGGWDIGCKLRVLSNQNQSTKIPKISKDCPIPDHIELFLQGGSQQASPFFSMTELKDGLYSIEFNSSISLLQSFFVCVSVLSCKRPFNLLDMSEAKVFKEPILNENDGSQGRASAKYAPNPPSSPVGRV
ncbi:hypothetical protein CMV_025220 [Castanea mollissima]|uniref:DUF3527 domain protein n=1 Tax=Castanea mollissima TaxID=60419 RepID=A0A8J4QMD2_9ROSI|nr:hypothetical protein CMV_025220 [Castanea mollissima]